MRAEAILLLGLLTACNSSESVEEGRVISAAQLTPGRIVIDVRDPRDFALGHEEGALNLQWGWDQLEDRVLAYVPDTATPIAVRAATGSRARKARTALEERGYTDVVILSGQPGEVGHGELPLITARELAERLKGVDAPIVIDVRTPQEWKRGTIEGSILVEQDAAPGIVEGLDPAGDYAIICAGGYRSSQLASLLQSRGFEHMVNVIDGMSAWYDL